jgi:2-octaprenylphenol hydroxylase
MKSNYDIVIVGGGMVGAALAAALGGSDFKLAVVEHQPPPAPPEDGHDLRVSAVTLATQTLFERLGAWPAMQKRRVAPVRAMEIWNEGGSIRFDAAEIGEPCLAYIVENSVIQSALLERLQQFTNVHVLCPAEIADYDLRPDGSTVTLRDGRALGARLVVGADGADSATRRAAGIETRGLRLDQKGIVATVRTGRPHQETARQRFLASGPLAFLPLSEPYTCSIVWSADTPLADELLALDDAAFLARLQQAFGDSLGKLQSVGPRAGFALALSHARAYTAAGLALVGDAAHTVHPLAGQGVNLGFLDAAALAEVLLEARAARRDFGAHTVLRRYERWRKGDNLAMIAVTGGFKYLFGNNLPIMSGLRNLGLDLTDRAGPIKNLIMRRAAGLDGDLPALARHTRSTP